MKIIYRKNIVSSMVLVFCFILASAVITKEAVADYWISGQVGAGAGPGIFSERTKNKLPVTSYFDDMVAVGPAAVGNRGEGHYSANLATGSLSASAYANDGYFAVLDPSGNVVRYDQLWGGVKHTWG